MLWSDNICYEFQERELKEGSLELLKPLFQYLAFDPTEMYRCNS